MKSKHIQKFRKTSIGMVPDDWDVKKLGNVFQLNQGLQIPSKIRINIQKSGYIPLLKITDLSKKIFSDFVSEDDVELQYVASKDDIIYTRTGQVGLVFTDLEGCVHNNCFKIHYGDFDKLFVYYMLRQKRIYQYANSVASGSVQKDLTHPAFKSCIISFPKNHDEQIQIGKILGRLDSKIENLQNQNKILEQIAQTVFKSWFVDYEFPNEDGKPYKSSGGEMVYNKELKKEIPKGWRIQVLDKLGYFKNGINYSRNESGNSNFHIINVRNLVSTNFILKSTLDEITIDDDKAKGYLLKKGDIVIARSASPGETIFVVNTSKKMIYSGFSIRLRSYNPIYQIYLFSNLQYWKNILINKFSDGTTLKNINQTTLKQIKIILPEDKILIKYNLFLANVYQKILSLLSENKILIETRDSLLPKLMSGEIRV